MPQEPKNAYATSVHVPPPPAAVLFCVHACVCCPQHLPLFLALHHLLEGGRIRDLHHTTQHITVRQHNVTHNSPAANTGQAWVLLSAKAVQHTQAVPCSLVAGAGWLVPTHLLHLCTLLLVDLLTLLNCCTVLRSSLQG